MRRWKPGEAVLILGNDARIWPGVVDRVYQQPKAIDVRFDSRIDGQSKTITLFHEQATEYRSPTALSYVLSPVTPEQVASVHRLREALREIDRATATDPNEWSAEGTAEIMQIKGPASVVLAALDSDEDPE